MSAGSRCPNAPVKGHLTDTPCPYCDRKVTSASHPSEVSVSPSRISKTTVEDSQGNMLELTPGVIDSNALSAFTSGQCLAFAVAACERLGSDKIMVVYSDALDEEDFDPWEHDRDYDPLDDGRNIVHHVWAVAPDGDVVDVEGRHQMAPIRDFVNADYGSRAWSEVMSVTEAVELCEPEMPSQAYREADSFAKTVLESH